MSSPSPLAVALIAGCAASTIGAMWATVSYFARRFLDQQRSNHGDTLEALKIARDIRDQLKPMGMRITRLEAAALGAAGLAAWAAWRKRQ